MFRFSLLKCSCWVGKIELKEQKTNESCLQIHLNLLLGFKLEVGIVVLDR